MNQRNLLLPLSLLLGTLTLGLQSASAASSSDVVAKYDADHDQTLDLNEVKSAASARFDRLDKDGDHTLDVKEVAGVVSARSFHVADPDNDGTLSKDEYLALAEKLFKQADIDHDGTLSAAELDSKSGRALRRLID